MENIFDFIISNIWLVIIVLGAISGIFGKKDKSPQKQNRNPRPTATPFDFPWEKAEPVEPKHQQAQPRQRKQASKELELRPIQAVKVENTDMEVSDYVRAAERTAAERASDRKPPHNRQQSQTHQQPKEASTPYQEALDFKNMNQQHVVQGIIWSQVLGKPRAKEPHRTFTMNRR